MPSENTPILPQQPRTVQGMADASARLLELDLPPLRNLTQVMEVAQAAEADWTPNHPRVYRGSKVWGEAIGEMRLLLKPLGWSNDEPHNQPLAVAPSGLVAVTVANADEVTGIVGPPYPKTNAAKGKRTRDAVHQNQASFFDVRPELTPQAIRTWFLLIHVDRSTGEVRGEISLPLGLDLDGHPTWWQERIILPPIDGTFAPEPTQIGPKAGNEAPTQIDVPVARRTVQQG